MELNKRMVMVKVALMLLLMMITATVDARLDRRAIAGAQMDLMSSFGILTSKSSKSEACCDSCTCTRSDPPQCQCHDWKETCYAGCDVCICQLIYPPRCRCFDITKSCLPTCSSSAGKAES
ncbi:hypothetical protein L6164_008227 [Bauhinia variegata]|uniref:Uncharacterized protein n=1 Tax=Bauhinia variegata TaxID=167791 RepID=A0ACB9PF41_BAUVA|nr:hypothetical protein L6164_008227 [Bauhinia variegata]